MAERKQFKADAIPVPSVGGGISITVQEHYNYLKLCHSIINRKISELKRERREFKRELGEFKREERDIEEEFASLKDKCSSKLAALEELEAESHDPQKELAKSVISQVEVTFAYYRQKIIDTPWGTSCLKLTSWHGLCLRWSHSRSSPDSSFQEAKDYRNALLSRLF